MAVRNDFTAGEVLAAADLNDTFGSRVPFAYGTATPTTTVDGFVWYDENETPPAPKFWDGAAFQAISAPSGLNLIDEQTFTNASTVSVSGKLTATYRNYRVIFYSNDSGSMRIRLRSGSTDDSAAEYDNSGRVSGAVNSDTTDAAQTSWRGLDGGNLQINFMVFDLLVPAIATPTGLTMQAYQNAPGTSQFTYNANGLHRASTAFDGFSIILGGLGDFTGTIKTYGYEGA